jgi:hypothetical protein
MRHLVVSGTIMAVPDVTTPRRRGKNKAPAWRRQSPVSVYRLPCDVHDPKVRRQIEKLFSAAFQVRRAVQQDARSRLDAYWAAHRDRADSGPKQVRDRLGLSRTALEQAAYRHLDRAPHLRAHLTKALAMHLADGVWEATDRHLFPDAAGRRHGRPKPGRWWEFTTIPGRARSHTKPNKWETFRLVGTLAGHRAAYHVDGRLLQPRKLRAVRPTAAGQPARSWWDHDGPLAILLTGVGLGDLVVPVRVPQGDGKTPVVEHYLGRPELWHKVDLVRHRDPGAVGGWRYEAHLVILGDGYVCPATVARRETAAQVTGRGGVDVNVSNLAVVSIDGGVLRATRVTRDADEKARLVAEQVKQRRRQRALERSRRSTNPGRYELSSRQRRRAARRAAAGLPPVQVATPRGPRVVNVAGVPAQAYRKDTLSATYRRLRGQATQAGEARTRARRDRARTVAAELVAVHGTDLVVEDCNLTAWARLWGRGIHAFTPGMLVTALTHETAEVAKISDGPALVRAGTRRTAWSQHCVCGIRVTKTLADRVHTCPHCGLTGDRDLISALVGAHTVFGDRADPATARIYWSAAHHTLDIIGVETLSNGLQGARSESTGNRPTRQTSGGLRRPRRHPDPRRWRARRSAGTSRQPIPGGTCRLVPSTTPNETFRAAPSPDTTTLERRGTHPGLRSKPGRPPDL